MPAPLIIKIDVTKLNKEWFFRSDKGPVYADLVLYYNDQPDQYGNDCAIKQNPPKSVRDAQPEVKGHYVGNAKLMPQRGGASRPPQQRQQSRPAQSQADNWENDPAW